MTSAIALRQPYLIPELCPLTAAVKDLAETGGVEARGAIFTRSEVVNFLLDLAGYTADKQLHSLRLLEPSFGRGDFLLPSIQRLLESWQSAKFKTKQERLGSLAHCIRAVELHSDTFNETKLAVIRLLREYGISQVDAQELANLWLISGDYLLTELHSSFDVVIGNPPYVRQELIPDVLLSEYRARFHTMYDRADLYIPFIEKSLLALADGGNLSFICADRWMKNKYGAPLRKLVAERFYLRAYVDMVDTPAFHSDVIAYPAITLISNAPSGVTRVAHRPSLEPNALRSLALRLLGGDCVEGNIPVHSFANVAREKEPWIFDQSEQMAVIRRLEAEYPLVEETGCKIGIGVATGADDAFIGMFDELDVEDDRKLPLVMTGDIKEGFVAWRGFGVINPFADEGGLVDLKRYPRLRRYLEARKERIANRHCAQKTPANWYRTIDRITPSIAAMPKLLIPDIKGAAHIVYEEGGFYPHHNLYYITAAKWNLKALQAVLLSSVTRAVIETYSTKMRGGFLRFQAQYLRRLRLPMWENVPKQIQSQLMAAADSNDALACDEATFALYKLTNKERAAFVSKAVIKK